MIFPITIPGGIVVTLKIKWESWTLRVRKTGSDSNLHKYKDEFWCTNTIKCSQWPLNHSSNKETALNVLTCTFNESSSSCPEQTPSRWPMSIPSVHFTCKNKPLCLQFALLVGEECGIRGISLQQHEKWPQNVQGVSGASICIPMHTKLMLAYSSTSDYYSVFD